MSNLVNGTGATLYIDDGAVWKAYVCSRTFSISTNTEVLETSITGTGNWRTYTPGPNNFTASFDGLMSLLVNDSLELDIQWLENEQQLGNVLDFKASYIARDGREYTKEFSAIITNVTLDSSFDNITTFRLDLQGTGDIVNTIES